MPKIEGLEDWRRRLKSMEAKGKEFGRYSAVVGYTQTYAIKVHEDLDAHHKEGTQAKFLEAPARIYSNTVSTIILQTYKQTRDAAKSLMRGALFLLRQSQLIVPVDTGALRASGYAALEKDSAAAGQAAFARSESIRQRKHK